MKSPVKIGAAMAVLFALVKYGFFLSNPIPASITPMIFTNIFLLMASVFIALYLVKRDQTEGSTTLLDVKVGMQAGLPVHYFGCWFLVFFLFVNQSRVHSARNG